MLAAAMAAALFCVVPSLVAAGSDSPVKYPSAPAPDTVKVVRKAEAPALPQPQGLVKGVGRSRRHRPDIKPTLPSANRNDSKRVFLEYADTLRYVKLPVDPFTGEAPEPYQLLIGKVKFRKEGMLMFCDSAHFYENGDNFRAYGNVKMEQGDTLFVYGDELDYSGAEELATLYGSPGRKVRMINREVTLSTDVLNYSLADRVGYYEVGGQLTDKTNKLTSQEGEYYPDDKMAYFYQNVVLTGLNDSDTLKLYTDTLEYNTRTKVATIVDNTTIIGKDGDIESTSGTYDTNSGKADLFSRSTVHTRQGNTLTGDTIVYDRNAGFGEAFGMVIMTDSVKKSIIEGDYAYYNELTDSALVTGRALAKEFSHGDTLYIHGDTIKAYTDPVDSTKIIDVYHKVRFYRSDMQGFCDSLSYAGVDSVVYLYRHPVVWSDQRQIFGNQIQLHLNDSTIDWARLPDFAFMAEHVGEDCFNQMTGSDMTAWFNEKSELKRLFVEGSLQMFTFPMENDSTYNKFIYLESSNLDAYFLNNNIDHARVWPENEGNVTPLYLAKRSMYTLPKFAWYEDLRPVAPGDVFIIPEGMKALIESAPAVEPRKRVQRGEAAPNEAAPPEENPDQSPEPAPAPVNTADKEAIQEQTDDGEQTEKKAEVVTEKKAVEATEKKDDKTDGSASSSSL